MKNLKLTISVLALGLATSVSAQTTTNKWLIGVGAHATNHAGAGGEAGDVFKTAFSKSPLYKANNFTITPPLSKLTVARNLGKAFVIDWQTSVGNIDNKRFNTDKEFFLLTGLGLQVKIAGLLFGNENAWFDPYLRGGANYLRHDYSNVTFPRTDVINGKEYATYDKENVTGKVNHFAVSTGVGINFWLTQHFGFGVQGDYVFTPIDKSDVADFWQASATLNFRFGNTDRDKDGIFDKDDKCPDEPGLAEFQGCPDTDGDGIPNPQDACPEVAGPADNNGCPWPDTDGDGVVDKDDACPEVAGPADNNGCPWPDTDGDGVLDKDDKCPTVPGLAEYDGCPKPKDVIATEATGALKDIIFDFNKSTINHASDAKLDQAAELIKSATDGTFLVTGYTDKKGNDNYNLKLSRERAAAVVKALEDRGVSYTQLKSVGVGERDAVVPETASDEERAADRKVVVEAVNGAAWESLQKSDLPVVKKKTVVKKASHKRRRK